MSEPIHLDDLLTPDDAATWLKFKRKRELLEKSKGRNPKIFPFRLSRKAVVYHPRTVLAKLARDNGAPLDFIAAVFGSGAQKEVM